ncbi:MAG: hypothetical protein ACKO8Q_10435, partial [Bacteroidota bacterium]
TLADFPNAVRILVTGYADIEAVIDAINRGQVYRYVAKPWNENDLRVCILNAIERFNFNSSSNSAKPSTGWLQTKEKLKTSFAKIKNLLHGFKGESESATQEVVAELNKIDDLLNKPNSES